MTIFSQVAKFVTDRFERSAHHSDAGSPEIKLNSLISDYDNVVKKFYAYLPDNVRDIFIDDAIYHKARYLELLSRSYGPRVLELGSDKPFISHFLRELHPGSTFDTVSIDIPFSKYPIVRVDIEGEDLPYEDGTFSDVIFTEVLEHLFRDPSWTIFQINRVLAVDGMLFLTTPNACGYDGLINLINLVNPNARSQFYASIESGHPHLWTASECSEILTVHGFRIESIDTVNYAPIPLPDEFAEFINKYSRDKSMHGQSLRVLATKAEVARCAIYPKSIFPDERPVQLQGAVLEWATRTLHKQQGIPSG